MRHHPYHTALSLSAAIRNGEISSTELTRMFLDQIAQHNKKLHAIVIPLEKEALRQAARLDEELHEGHVRGPFHGLPMTVKESFNLQGHKTTINVQPLANNIAHDDAMAVENLKNAGAVILGKTNVPAMLFDFQCTGPLYPTANNPYDLSRTPGGSTGGGAAALAAGLSTLELGSDLGGSIRLPAHYCGLFGLKPSENDFPQSGHVPLAPHSNSGIVLMNSTGPLARSAEDLEALHHIANRADWHYLSNLPVVSNHPPKTSLSQYRIAWTDHMAAYPCNDATRTALHKVVHALEQTGATVMKKSLDDVWLHMAYEVFGFLCGIMLGQDLPPTLRWMMKYQYGRIRGKQHAPETVRIISNALNAGLNLNFKAYAAMLRERQELIAGMQTFFEDFDLFLCPTAMGPAIKHCKPLSTSQTVDGRTVGYWEYVLPFTSAFNASGHPVLVFPAGQDGDGLPIGLQVVGPYHAEANLLHVAKEIEKLGFGFMPPPEW